MKQQFLKDDAGILKTFIYKDNQIIIPASATITIFKPGSSTKIVEDQAMDVGSDGLLTFTVVAGNNDIADENYKTVITYTYNAEVKEYLLFYDVVRSILYITITDEDVISELPNIKNKGFKTMGTAKSGTTSTIVDSELQKHADDYFTGGLAYSIDKDEARLITNFESATGTVTTNVFTSAITTDKYILTRSFTKEISRAFEIIEDLLVRAGKRPHLILDSYDLREIHIYYAVAAICKGLAPESESVWWELMDKYEKKAYAMFKSITLKYDDDNDGIIQEDEENTKIKDRFTGRT